MHRRQHAAVHMQNGIVECKYAVLSTLATPEYARFPNIGHSLIEVKKKENSKYLNCVNWVCACVFVLFVCTVIVMLRSYCAHQV